MYEWEYDQESLRILENSEFDLETHQAITLILETLYMTITLITFWIFMTISYPLIQDIMISTILAIITLIGIHQTFWWSKASGILNQIQHVSE